MMSNTIDSPNFLTFPVVLDPFNAYKNIEKDLEKSALDSKKEETNNVQLKVVKPNEHPLFISMVSHQVKFDRDGSDFVTNEIGEEDDDNGISKNGSEHSLGKYCPLIHIWIDEFL